MGLSRDHELHLISLSEEVVAPASIEKLKNLTASLKIFRISGSKALARAAKGILNLKPFQVNYFFSPKINKEIQTIIDEISPDLIYCQLIRMAEYVVHRPEIKVLDFMDCFSMNYAKRQEFEHFFMKQVSKQESTRLSKYEAEVLDSFDEAIIISKRDAEEIDTDRKIHIISNGINTDYFAPIHSSPDCDILFVGNMGYQPNVLAARFIANEIVPLLNVNNYQIKIAGARPSLAVRRLAQGNIEITGWLPDIRSAYSSTRLFIAPIFSGAGQQNKILEAMAMELICITTSNVNEAIGATNGKHLLIADSAPDFAKLIAQVLSNEQDYINLRKEARNFVFDHFSWQKENKRLNDVIIKAGKELRNEG